MAGKRCVTNPRRANNPHSLSAPQALRWSPPFYSGGNVERYAVLRFFLALFETNEIVLAQ